MVEWGIKKENNKAVGWVADISSINSKETIRVNQHLSRFYIPCHSGDPFNV